MFRGSLESLGAKQGSGELSRSGNEPAALVTDGLLSLVVRKAFSICGTGPVLQLPPSFPVGSSEITQGIGNNLIQSPSDKSLRGQGQGLSGSAARTLEHIGPVSRGLGCCEFFRPQEGGHSILTQPTSSAGVWAQPSPRSPCLTWRGSLGFCAIHPSSCSGISSSLLWRC